MWTTRIYYWDAVGVCLTEHAKPERGSTREHRLHFDVLSFLVGTQTLLGFRVFFPRKRSSRLINNNSPYSYLFQQNNYTSTNGRIIWLSVCPPKWTWCFPLLIVLNSPRRWGYSARVIQWPETLNIKDSPSLKIIPVGHSPISSLMTSPGLMRSSTRWSWTSQWGLVSSLSKARWLARRLPVGPKYIIGLTTGISSLSMPIFAKSLRGTL